MSDHVAGQPLPESEVVARYVLKKDHVRADGTVKSDAFIPRPHVALSVTRHLGLTEAQIWESGRNVAARRSLSLVGRADNVVADYVRRQLRVICAPLEGNPNHADAVDWPDANDKPAQKIKAQEIAADSRFSHAPVFEVLP